MSVLREMIYFSGYSVPYIALQNFWGLQIVLQAQNLLWRNCQYSSSGAAFVNGESGTMFPETMTPSTQNQPHLTTNMVSTIRMAETRFLGVSLIFNLPKILYTLVGS